MGQRFADEMAEAHVKVARSVLPFRRRFFSGKPPSKFDDPDHILIDAVIEDLSAPSVPRVFVTAEMCDLLFTAAVTLPDFELASGDLPWPSALLKLERDFGEVNVAGSDDRDMRRLVVIGWDLMQPTKWVVPVVETAMFGPDDEWDGELQPWALDHWQIGDSLSRRALILPGSDLLLERRLAALWLLLKQRVAITDHWRASRAASRRWTRAMDEKEIPETLVIRLRRPTIHHDDDPSAHLVDWSHRWMVDGHWRQHWYPSLNAHRPLWIAPHIKGPEDKPLVVKDRVYAWTR